MCVFDLMALVLKPLANYKHSIVNSVSQCILICFSDSSTRLVSSAQRASSSQHPRSLLFHYCSLPPLPHSLWLSLSLSLWQILYAICNSWAAPTDSYHLFCAIEWEPDEAGPATEEGVGQGEEEGEAFDLLAITIFMAASQQQRQQLKTCGNQIGVVENWIYCERSERKRDKRLRRKPSGAPCIASTPYPIPHPPSPLPFPLPPWQRMCMPNEPWNVGKCLLSPAFFFCQGNVCVVISGSWSAPLPPSHADCCLWPFAWPLHIHTRTHSQSRESTCLYTVQAT